MVLGMAIVPVTFEVQERAACCVGDAHLYIYVCSCNNLILYNVDRPCQTFKYS